MQRPLEASAPPARIETLGDLLVVTGEKSPDQMCVRFLSDRDPLKVDEATYGRLLAAARSRAAGLQAVGVQSGDRVVIVLPTGPDFLSVFFGAVLAGATPVAAYPPVGLGRLDEYAERLAATINDSGAVALVTSRAIAAVMGKTLSRTPHLREVMTPAQLDRSPDHLRPVPLVPDDTALLQYTSGSTGAQKGVELSHRNILSNVHAMGLGMRCRPYVDVSCSWLPLCHDMGLIGGLFTSMYWQMILVMLSPQAFIGDPKRWLWTFHHHQVTLSTAPNFAYELCARRIPEEELAGLDLSSWRLALNGAEPVAMASLDAFATRFEKHGFRRDAFFPVYGLAESTLAVTFPVPNAPLITDVVERDGLETRGVAVPAEAESATLHVVSVGRPIDGAHVRVVDAEGRVLPDRQVGELETRGPSVMKGYFRAPEASARTLRDGWLRTGDLAYLVDGNLFIAGREKDLIITRGRNYYPHDLEAAVERLPGVRTGCTAAFGVPDETTGTESVVLLVETKVEREATPSQAAALIETIQKALSTAIGLRADQVVLLPPRTLPRTTSGKLQRREARRRFLAGTLLTTKPPRWSLARTVARSLLELARHRWRRRFGNAGAP